MNINWIFTKARRDCFIEESDYIDANAIIDLNLIYDDFVGRIIDEVDEDFFWDSSVDDAVAGQSEYPVETTSWYNIIDINKIFIRYNTTDTYPIKARRVSPATLDKHPDYYSANQSKADPIYYVQDNSIFLYPAPTETITDGLQIYTINEPLALEIWGTETTIKIPKRFHRVLVIGLKQYIYSFLGKLNEKNDAINEYEQAVQKAVQQLRDRDQGEIIDTMPNLSHLE